MTSEIDTKIKAADESIKWFQADLITRINQSRDGFIQYKREQETKFSETKILISNCATLVDLDNLRTLLDRYCTSAQLNNFKQEVQP